MKSRGQLHALKCDIKSCYDQLDLHEVVKITWNLLKRTYEKPYIHAKILWDKVTFEESDEKIANDYTTRCIKQCDVKDWLMKMKDLKIQYNKTVCTFNFIAHSLVVSTNAVNLYLQKLLKKFIVEELQRREPKADYKIFRYLDDMVILSESKEMCEEIWRLLTKTTRINNEGDRLKLADEKTVRSGSNDDIIIAGVNLGSNVNKLFFTPTRVANIYNVRGIYFIQPSCLATIQQLTKYRIVTGSLLRFL